MANSQRGAGLPAAALGQFRFEVADCEVKLNWVRIPGEREKGLSPELQFILFRFAALRVSSERV